MSLVIADAVITNAGENMFAQVVVGSGALTLTSVQFGSGFPAPGDNIPAYTGLNTFVMNGQITGANNLVQSQATIRVNISSANAPSVFQVNEIGVFAQIGAGAPVMIAYASTGAATGDTVTPSLPGSAIVKDYALLILFGQQVPASTTVTLQQVVGLHAPNHLDNGIDPIPPPSTARSGLLLANPNNASMGLIGTNPPSWSAVLRVLTVNTTLYVSTIGNDSTAVPNDPTHPWLTIQGALNFLTPYFILPSITIIISVGAGIYSITSPINVTHPQGAQITISGPSVATTTISSVSVTGSTSNWSVTYHVASAAGLAVNGWILVRSIAGIANDDEGVVSGVFSITAIAGTAITCHNPYVGTSFPSISAINSGVIQPITAIVTVASTGQNAFNVSTSLGSLKCVGMTSTYGIGPNYAVSISQAGTLNCTQIFAWGFGTGSGAIGGGGIILASASTGTVTACAMLQCENGYVAGTGAELTTTGCYAHTCPFAGYRSESGGSMTLTSFNFAVGCATPGYGILADNGSNTTIFQVAYTIRNQYGIFSLGSSVVRLSEPGTSVVSVNNSIDDLAVSIGSYITGVGNIVHSTQSNPSNVLTSDGSYIS